MSCPVIGLHFKEDKKVRERTIKYSEAFKLQVIKELKRGKFSSLTEARERYGIGGGSTIHTWLKKYGRKDILPIKVRVEMPDEQDVIKKLNKRIRELEKAVADSKVKEILSQAHFEVLCEQMGIEDIEAQKKKIAEQLSQEE